MCPRCKGSLDLSRTEDAYYCPSCEIYYRLQGGIPDFRVYADPYLGFNEEHKRTEIVLDGLHRFKFKELLEYYWGFSDITPVALRPKFIRSAMLGEERANGIINLFDKKFSRKQRQEKDKIVLEIGSGTGNFLAIAMQRYGQVIGTDIAMRWLHVSRRRFMDRELPIPPLVCCCAEYLPFADESFDLVVAASTIEFVRDKEKMIAECARALTRTGSVYLNTVNRYSIATNPYTYLWGVGYLPRSIQAKYVRWRQGASYEPVKLFSFRELRRITKKYFESVEVLLPMVDSSALTSFPWLMRMQAHIYGVLKTLPLIKTCLKWVGPSWDVILRNQKLSR